MAALIDDDGMPNRMPTVDDVLKAQKAQQAPPPPGMDPVAFQRMLGSFYSGQQQVDPALVKMVMGLGPENLKNERIKGTLDALRKEQNIDHSAHYGERGGAAMALGDAIYNGVKNYRKRHAEQDVEEADKSLGSARQTAGENYFAEAGKGRPGDAMPITQFQQPVQQAQKSPFGVDQLKLDPDMMKQFAGLDLSKLGPLGGE